MASEGGQGFDERFGHAFLKTMAEEAKVKAQDAWGVGSDGFLVRISAQDEQIRIGKSAQEPAFVKQQAELGAFEFNNPISKAGYEAGKFVNDVANLAGDDLYTAYSKWAERPENLGALAAKLNVHANWAFAHGKIDLAISEYQRELRLIKSCGGTGSSLAKSVENTIKALEFPSAYNLSADKITEIDLLRRKSN